jgi:polyhydroxyalkanoate synthesis regulator phasin
MKNMNKQNSKSLVSQLLDAKKLNDEDAYEDLYLEISEQIEALCYKLQNDCSDNYDAVTALAEILRSKANDLDEHAADLK